MKKLLTFAACACMAVSAFGQGGNISAPVVRRNALPPVTPPAQAEGSLQRGVRVGNPLQMFSPFAPAEYGTGADCVTPRDQQDQGLRPRDRSRAFPIGLRLISIAF